MFDQINQYFVCSQDKGDNDSGSSKDRKSKNNRNSGDDDSTEHSVTSRRDDMISEQASVIRNPFLRPVKKPKLKYPKLRKWSP